jgi:hypothetical protein
MSVSPLDVTPWIARIKAQCPAVKFVGRAADNQSAIEQGPKVNPAAFVLEPAYSSIGTPNASNNSLIQMLMFEVPVLVVCQNYGDALGANAGADNYTARAQVWTALIGWNPAADGFCVSAGQGRLLKFDNQFFYYLDTYRLQAQIRNFS